MALWHFGVLALWLQATMPKRHNTIIVHYGTNDKYNQNVDLPTTHFPCQSGQFFKH